MCRHVGWLHSAQSPKFKHAASTPCYEAFGWGRCSVRVACTVGMVEDGFRRGVQVALPGEWNLSERVRFGLCGNAGNICENSFRAPATCVLVLSDYDL